MPPEPARTNALALGELSDQVHHRAAEQRLVAAGWTRCGAGDWAIALRSPDGMAAARISPFDPTGPYNAALYREAASTRQVPELFAHRRLAGGGDLQVMEWLAPVPEHEAVAFHQQIINRTPEVADLVDAVHRIHDRARRELPWCGPLDHNPANVMRAMDGRLVVVDLFYADGPNLYATAAEDPDLVVARIPKADRRFMTEIPLAASGPWQPGAQEAIRAGLENADARRSSKSGQQSTVPTVRFRDVEADDVDLLWTMLALAAHLPSGTDIHAAAADDPRLAAYVGAWGQDGDCGVVAEIDHAPVGAAWVRRWNEDRVGYVDIPGLDLPELAIAVAPGHQAMGIGGRLIDALAERVPGGIVLSVLPDNPAVHLYERKGFVTLDDAATTNRAGGTSLVMAWRPLV